MLKGFRDFILRGNVMDLAVAVILGAAFNAIVSSLVSDVLNPLIAATVGKPDFSSVILHVGGGQIKSRQLLQRGGFVPDRGLRGLFRHCSAHERITGAHQEARRWPNPPQSLAPNASATFRWPPSAARTALNPSPDRNGRSPVRDLIDVARGSPS
jgi:hypothetical protein